MKKRTFILISILVIFVLALCACGGETAGTVTSRTKAVDPADLRDSAAAASRPRVSRADSIPRGSTTISASDIIEKISSADDPMPLNDEDESPAPAETPESTILTEEAAHLSEGFGMSDCESFFYETPLNTAEYNAIEENGFRQVLTSPLSTFAADVDTASYANIRSMIGYGIELQHLPAGIARAEEMINYFDYTYAGPEENEPFGVNAQISACPWNPEHMLLMLGLQTEEADFSETPPSNLVFLIDVSGSMDEPNKLPLLIDAFSMLASELDEKDRVSIVTYASGDSVVLDSVPGNKHEMIIEALRNLCAGGCTYGSKGIQTAYELAAENYIEGGNNRVILASDGDFNVGITSQAELKELIREEKEKGIFLSVLGFGYGNYSDANMETLADCGNGNYAYIDSFKEAKKVLVDELAANMLTVAKDVKLQIEFNPAYISEYRQIGYENRQLAAEDFDNDAKDGGEVGAGHSVTVLYELVPADGSEIGKKLKYQESSLSSAAGSGEWATLSIRYKEPDSSTSSLLEYTINNENLAVTPSDDFTFAAAVAEFAMVLNNSDYLALGSLSQIQENVDTLDLDDPYKIEFVEMVNSVI